MNKTHDRSILSEREDDRELNKALPTLPEHEDDRHEYKGSQISPPSLKTEIEKAASAFWNSGGGTLFVGIDDNGKPDGGILPTVGNGPMQDWVHRVLHGVLPTGKYSIDLYKREEGIVSGRCVLGIEFAESRQIPHMAPDHRYYIRAGAHSWPASHYIVEALWARRRFTRPNLVHTLRFKPDYADIVQLGIIDLADEPALDVSVTLNPVPLLWSSSDPTNPFPLVVPLVDRGNPFFMDLVVCGMQDRDLGKDVHLKIEYQDTTGSRFTYDRLLGIGKALGLWNMGTEASERIAKAAESIEKTLSDLAKKSVRINTVNK